MPDLTRWLLLVMVLAVACAGHAQEAPTSRAPRVLASCGFEGPYSAGEQQVQQGCVNNWQWGRKDMVLRADEDTKRAGTVQRIQTRGISSGGVQFFFTDLRLKKGHHYRISYWMRTDGLEGPIRCYVRKLGYPWTVYIPGGYAPEAAGWREYTITGMCAEDVDGDVGVCWETGSLGTFWLDDLKVEEATTPFAAGEAVAPPEPSLGNMLPRSSFEGRRDHLRTMISFGGNRNGVWEGEECHWEDCQMYRAEGGKVGRYCLAIPSGKYAGQGACVSTLYELVPGRAYTVSAWMRVDKTGYTGSMALLYWGGARNLHPLGSVYPKLTTEWQRVSFTCTPEPDPASADDARLVPVALQIAPSGTEQGTLYVDGLQLEPGDAATDYKPQSPLELYVDIGQDGGNLIEWGQAVPLNLLAAAADTTNQKDVDVELTVTAYPDTVVWRETVALQVGRETALPLSLKRRGLFRLDMRAVNPAEAAPQEMVFAVIPKAREVGDKGMFGGHLALRPFLCDYFRKLGFTWTRLHDCSLLTKWDANEREPGRLTWHDEVAAGVRACGMHILGLPDSEPEWAKVKGKPDANPVDVEAYGRYCEEVARHYKGTIDHWELWNEPYMPGSYSGGPVKFGELMEAGYAGLKRGNPECTVVGWCADVSNPGWAAQIPETARKCIDVFSFHNYVNNLAGGGTLPFVAELPDHRAQWPAGVKECWDTEGTNGALCANSMYTFLPGVSRETNERAVAFASRVWLEHARRGVGRFFVYQMHNTDSIMYYGGYQSMYAGYDRTPTPAAVSTAVTAYCMDAMRPAYCRQVAGVVQSLFEEDGRATWAIYDDGGEPGRLRLDLRRLPEAAQVLDTMGNDPRTEGAQMWEIGPQPLFVVLRSGDPRRLAVTCRRAVVR